jgi:hypothetical protein
MTQYVETTNENLINTIRAMINDHLANSEGCSEVVSTMKHLTEDKWLFDYDCFVCCVGKKFKEERMSQIGEFIGENGGIYFQDYDSLVEAGYKEESEE